MKTVDGVKYFTIGEVSNMIGRTAQTIKNWYQYEAETDENLLPEPNREIDAKRTYYFKESDIVKLEQFRDSIKYGTMAEFNARKWGARGQSIIDRRESEIDHGQI